MESFPPDVEWHGAHAGAPSMTLTLAGVGTFRVSRTSASTQSDRNQVG